MPGAPSCAIERATWDPRADTTWCAARVRTSSFDTGDDLAAILRSSHRQDRRPAHLEQRIDAAISNTIAALQRPRGDRGIGGRSDRRGGDGRHASRCANVSTGKTRTAQVNAAGQFTSAGGSGGRLRSPGRPARASRRASRKLTLNVRDRAVCHRYSARRRGDGDGDRHGHSRGDRRSWRHRGAAAAGGGLGGVVGGVPGGVRVGGNVVAMDQRHGACRAAAHDDGAMPPRRNVSWA